MKYLVVLISFIVTATSCADTNKANRDQVKELMKEARDIDESFGDNFTAYIDNIGFLIKQIRLDVNYSIDFQQLNSNNVSLLMDVAFARSRHEQLIEVDEKIDLLKIQGNIINQVWKIANKSREWFTTLEQNRNLEQIEPLSLELSNEFDKFLEIQDLYVNAQTRLLNKYDL